MKLLYQVFSFKVLFLLVLLSDNGYAQDIKVTFRIDVSELPNPDSVGIFGNIYPLSQDKIMLLERTDSKEIFAITISFPDSVIGKNLIYTYEYGNHVREGVRHRSIIRSNDGQQFNDKWGYLDGVSAKVKPQKPIHVLKANSPEEMKALKEPFKGITTNGVVVTNLYSIHKTGVKTKPIQTAVLEFLNTLNKDQRIKCTFPVESDEWQRWHNTEIYERTGISLEELTKLQKELVFAILKNSLSTQGVTKVKNIMAMEDYLASLTRDNINNKLLGGEKYWFTFMGQPSDKEPWGWQIDGHHLIINYFILGDQVVVTPYFMGSEPTEIKAGKNAGIRTFDAEQRKGLTFYAMLSTAQKAKAKIWNIKDNDFNQAQSFSDNVIIPNSGIRAIEFTGEQKVAFINLIAEYVNNIKEGSAKVKMNEVKKHLDETYFTWVQGESIDSPFYYRIYSPVILIEFDQQRPVLLWDRSKERPGPGKSHIHTVVRTPNGNDYGKDLLRQHLKKHHSKN